MTDSLTNKVFEAGRLIKYIRGGGWSELADLLTQSGFAWHALGEYATELEHLKKKDKARFEYLIRGMKFFGGWNKSEFQRLVHQSLSS